MTAPSSRSKYAPDQLEWLSHFDLPPSDPSLQVIYESSYPTAREWLPIREVKDYSLVFPVDRKNGKVLLGLKKRRFSAGLWNGFGGKPDPGETMEQTAIRELQEESGITATRLIPKGIALYYSDEAIIKEGGDHAVRVFMYTVEEWSGEPVETDEMRPEWFPIPIHVPNTDRKGQPTLDDSLPWHVMHVEANYYLPFLLASPPSTQIYARVDYYPLHKVLATMPESDGDEKDGKAVVQVDKAYISALKGDWVMGKWWIASS